MLEQGDSGKQTVVRGLKHICFSLDVAKFWPTIKNKLVLEDAKLYLTVADPREKNAKNVSRVLDLQDGLCLA